MTTVPASNVMTNTNKRVRFITPSMNNMTKSLTEESSVTLKATSIQYICIFSVTLRKHLLPIILNEGLTHIELLHKFATKCHQHAKMESDEDFIPRSDRLMNFEFMVSKQVESSEEFLGIKLETEELVKEFRLNLKGKIMQTLKIEFFILRQDLYENFTKEIH